MKPVDLEVRGWLDALPEGQAATAERLYGIVIDAAPDLDVAMKWGKPTFALGGDFHHWICQISATKRAVGLTFHFGALLDAPPGAFNTGTSAWLRKLDYAGVDNTDASLVVDLVGQAIAAVDRFKAELGNTRTGSGD